VSRFEEAIEIAAPAARVFDMAADPRNLPRIDPRTSVELLSGAWTRPGSRHHVTHRRGGSIVDEVHEVIRYEPPRLAEERSTTRGTIVTARMEVRPMGPDRCVLVLTGEIDWGGSFVELVARLLHPLTGPPGRRRALERIRDAVDEAERSSPDPESHLGEEG
jgi:Polyketide cyclase / dehydrase and lipid transport